MADRFEDWLTGHQVEPLAPRPDAYPRIARSARRRRAGRAVAGVAAASVALAVVSGGAYRLTHPPGPPDPPATTPTVSPPEPEPEPAPTSASPTPARPSSPAGTGTTPPVTGRCRTGELRVTVQAAPGGGAAGSNYLWLIFTNTAARTCTLYGFPGVSYVTGASGAQINDPALRDSGTPVRVTLTPGQGAHATLQIGHYAAFPDTCGPVKAAGYRVYVPDETAWVFVSAPVTACSTNGVNVMTISAVRPGVTG